MVNQALALRAMRFLRDKAFYRIVVYRRVSPESLKHIDRLSADTAVLTVAFNQPALIRLQLEGLTRFIQPAPAIIIVDNSSHPESRQEIAALAKEFGATYIRAPFNPFSSFQGSLSHASTLDWAWSRIIGESRVNNVLLLDHDIFPVAKLSLGSLFQGVAAAGVREERAGMWYLWPGFLAINRDLMGGPPLSFMPYRELDTGGSLWRSHYQSLSKDSTKFLTQAPHQVGERGNKQESEIELIDGRWVHLVDGSGWLDGVGKLDRLVSAPTSSKTKWRLEDLIGRLKQLGAPLP
ncbi:MAG: glycosyltransferase [Microbacteriaceae bacterium]|nr:glycosyltransferase [Microbacteriaceae bacterium]